MIPIPIAISPWCAEAESCQEDSGAKPGGSRQKKKGATNYGCGAESAVPGGSWKRPADYQASAMGYVTLKTKLREGRLPLLTTSYGPVREGLHNALGATGDLDDIGSCGW